MVLKVELDADVPSITRLSPYRSSPRFSMAGALRPPRPGLTLGPGEYPLCALEKTSKFSILSRPCSFGSAKRFAEDNVDAKRTPTNEPGPGSYDSKLDYSHIPFHSASSATFGSGDRMFPKKISRGAMTPGPVYDVIGRDRRGEASLVTSGAAVAGRHGWYYDVDVKAHKDVPGPGSYKPKMSANDPTFVFGSSKRPELYPLHTKSLPGPGTYQTSDKPSTAYSFTKASLENGSSFARLDRRVPGSMTAQPSQFIR